MSDAMYLVEVGRDKRILTDNEIQILEENMVEVIILKEVDPNEHY